MPQFDFPSTPSIGDLFQDSTSGAVYRWNGYAWIGGVTGIGLQTVKETRYLVPGSFTHTRDPKSSGFADIHLLGAQGGRPAQAWAAGQIACTSGGGCGAIGIKWKYALPPSAPVVVGASSGTVDAGASSFDTAAGGKIGVGGAAASATPQAYAGGLGGAAGSSCDENYGGQGGGYAQTTNSAGIWTVSPAVFFRGIIRIPVGPTQSGAAIPLALGGPGAVVVLETLNP
jgi:hypothetical protein